MLECAVGSLLIDTIGGWSALAMPSCYFHYVRDTCCAMEMHYYFAQPRLPKCASAMLLKKYNTKTLQYLYIVLTRCIRQVQLS